MKQEEARRITIEKIQDAIDTVIEEGGIVTKKKLIEITGLSNATFSKAHVKELLEINKVCQYRTSKKITVSEDNNVQSVMKINQLKKEVYKLESKLQDKDIVIMNLKKEQEELSDKYEMLLGKLHIIMRKVNEQNIDIGLNFDDL